MTEYWYRYEDPWDESGPVWLGQYRVLKHTPKGVWIDYPSTPRGKFVLNDSFKQWACPTIEAAKESYIRRKRRQISILAAQHDRAVSALHVAEAGRWQEEPLRLL